MFVGYSFVFKAIKFWLKHWGEKASNKGTLGSEIFISKTFWFSSWSNKSNFFLLQALLGSLLICWFVSVDELGKADASCDLKKKNKKKKIKNAAHVV